MDEATTGQLNRALEGMMSTMSDGKDFVLEQAPLVCQEYVAYTLAVSLLTVIVQVILFISLIWMLRTGLKKGNECKWAEGSYILYLTISIIGLLFLPPMALTNGQDGGVEASPAYERLLKAKYAPRVLLLEKASELMLKK